MMPSTQRTLFTAVAIHLITCCVCVNGQAAAEHRARITVDYVAQFRRMSRPPGYDPSKDARPHYEKALASIEDCPRQLTNTDLRARYADLSPAKQKMLSDWVQRSEEAIDHLKRATALPYYCPEYEGDFMQAVISPNLPKVRQLAFASCARARLHAANGRFDKAFNDSVTCYRMGRHFGGAKPLVEQLVGIAARAMAVETSRQIIYGDKLDKSLLGQTQAVFEDLAESDPPLDFNFERLTYYDCIQRVFTDDGKGGGKLAPDPWGGISMPSRLSSARHGRALMRILGVVGSASTDAKHAN